MCDELYESIQEHCLSSLDEMRWQESFEIVHTIIGIPQQFSVQQSFVYRCFILSVSQSRSTFLRFQFCNVTPVINCIFIGKETGPSIVRQGNLCGHLLSHVNCCLLGSSSDCIWFMLIPWAIIIDNVGVKVIFIAMACQWALLWTPSAMLRYPVPLEEGQWRPSSKWSAKVFSQVRF